MITGPYRIVLMTALATAPLTQSIRAHATPASQPAAALGANPTLDRAEALINSRHWETAHDLLVPWLQGYPKARDRDRGLYLLAEAYFEKPDRIRAFYHLDELMDNFPESKFFFPALEVQYEIADAYLNGFKETLLGMRIVSETDEAIEMLYRIQDRSPGSPLAERALRRTADYYFYASEFDLAADAYGAYVRSYPRSPQIPQIRLHQAFASLARFRGPRFDATPLIDARAEFKEIEVQYPELAADANVSGWLDRIDSDLAHKSFVKADFYSRTQKPHGAAFMYRYVAQSYPNTHDADLARQALAKMPESVLSDPPPPQNNAESDAKPPVAPLGPPVPGANEKPR